MPIQWDSTPPGTGMNHKHLQRHGPQKHGGTCNETRHKEATLLFDPISVKTYKRQDMDGRMRSVVDSNNGDNVYICQDSLHYMLKMGAFQSSWCF